LEKNFGSKRNPELFAPYNISKFQAILAKQICSIVGNKMQL
jgi:hypothetical protein